MHIPRQSSTLAGDDGAVTGSEHVVLALFYHCAYVPVFAESWVSLIHRYCCDLLARDLRLLA